MQLNSYKEINIIYPTVKIKNYIIDLILPKCNIVFGKTFSSVFTQLLLYTNNKDINTWKYHKCWLNTKTIAKNINCNWRTVLKILDYMQKINLIEKDYHGKISTYELKCINLTVKKDIIEFNNNMENRLLEFAKNKKVAKNKFEKLNSIYSFNDKIYEFKNINKFRYFICDMENIQHGMTLMIIKFFANNYFNNNIKIIQNEELSEKERAIRLGCSQSTVSRYFKQLENYNYLEKEYKDINFDSFIFEYEKSDYNYVCPVCNKKVEDLKKLSSHLGRCKDDAHIKMNELIHENEIVDMEDVLNLFLLNKDIIGETNIEKDAKRKQTNKELNKIAYQLVKYYYDSTGTKCPSWAKEINLIRSHLSKDMNTQEVMDVMRYMSKRGYADLRFFNTNINNALLINQYKIDIKNEGTEAYLVKLFCKGINIKITDRLMLKSVEKIKELYNNGYNYGQVKTIIEYMIENNCSNFNFIVAMAPDALKKSKNKSNMAETYSLKEIAKLAVNNAIEYGFITVPDINYEILKKDIIDKLKQDICDGKVNLQKVNSKYNQLAVEMAKLIENKNLFNHNLSLEEWKNMINLNVK